jgi:hypothetical protein
MHSVKHVLGDPKSPIPPFASAGPGVLENEHARLFVKNPPDEVLAQIPEASDLGHRIVPFGKLRHSAIRDRAQAIRASVVLVRFATWVSNVNAVQLSAGCIARLLPSSASAIARFNLAATERSLTNTSCSIDLKSPFFFL